jgi:hypothetical protein
MIKTFNNLEFEPHPVGLGGVIAQMKLDNGYTISVVGGRQGLYGDGINTFEVAIFDRMNEMIMLSENDQVLGWQTKQEVNGIIEKFNNQKLINDNL